LIIGVAVFSTRPRPAVSASAPFEQSSAQLPQGGEMTAIAVGHEFLRCGRNYQHSLIVISSLPPLGSHSERSHFFVLTE
jgi:hypothetical protein